MPGAPEPLHHLFEMLSTLEGADERTRFLLRVHIGNHSLFLSGAFAPTIRSRAEERGFPDLKYYERLGRTHYRVASDHQLAQRYEVADILSTLSERFVTTRRALNDIAERCFFLGDPS